MDTLEGNNGPDTLIGDAYGNIAIYGYGGNDYLKSYGEGLVEDSEAFAEAYIYGGEGDDTLFGQSYTDIYSYGGYYDEETGEYVEDYVYENTRGNELYGEAGNDLLLGYIGSDLLDGGLDNDTLYGGSENDFLNGDAGDDLLFGEADDDVLMGGRGNDTLFGGSGSDRIEAYYGLPGLGVVQTDNIVTETRSEVEFRFLADGSGYVTLHEDYGVTDLNSGFTGGQDTYDRMSFFEMEGAYIEAADPSTPVPWEYLSSRVSGLDLRTQTTGDIFDNSAGEVTYNGFTLRGFQTFNAVYLGSGDDTVRLDGFADPFEAADSFFLGGGNDIMHAGTGDDTMDGGTGNDSLVGGEGNDSIHGGIGADTLVGGKGDDTYVVDNTGAIVVEAAWEGTDLVRASSAYTLGANIENLELLGGTGLRGTGNGLNNLLKGTTGNDTLEGSAGNDTLDGGTGSDSLLGGTGSDSLLGGAGLDVMNGGTGNDTYGVDDVGDIVVETATDGIDLVRTSVTYTLGAHVENLELLGSVGLKGTGNTLDNVMLGGSGNDTLNGHTGDDSLSGGAGNDSLHGSSGTDTMAGGLGNDTYDVDNGADVVVEADSEGTDLVRSNVAYTLGANVEDLNLFGPTGLKGTGNSLANVISGTSGNDTLNGHTGDDSLVGGTGHDSLHGSSGVDTLTGGLGNDTYGVDNGADVVVEAASQGTDLVRSNVAYTLGANVENLNLFGPTGLKGTGNSLANVISGTSGNDTLNGHTGDDSLVGGTGHDSLHGSSGVDTLTGGLGNDTYGVDNGADVVVEAASQGTDLVRSSVSYTLGANVENLEFLGSAGLKGTGNTLDNKMLGGRGNDTLNGHTGNDSLSGGTGHDSLYGSAGNDTMAGGLGNDTYGVDSTLDVVAEATSEGTDLVRSSISYTLGANVENLELLGSESLSGTGNSGDNQISGNRGRNTLFGSGGADFLLGGSGNDSLNGGTGFDTLNGANISTRGAGEIDTLTGANASDLFVLGDASGRYYDDGSSSTTGTGDYALITDFTVGTDRLQLDGAASSYYLGASPVAGVSGNAVFFENGANDELVAIIRSGNSTTLTTANTINTAVFV